MNISEKISREIFVLMQEVNRLLQTVNGMNDLVSSLAGMPCNEDNANNLFTKIGLAKTLMTKAIKKKLKKVKKLKKPLVDAVDQLSNEEKRKYLLDAEEFLRIEHLPIPFADWLGSEREIPQPALWIAILDKMSPDGFGLDQFLKGKHLEKHDISPLKVDESDKYQKWIEALAFIFNDIKNTWTRGDDYMTQQEADEWNRKENELLDVY
jgi:CRISPR/Cas system CSM-associated protein Csm2 small subunit